MPITWSAFDKVILQVGTITRAELFKEARKPAYIVYVNLGPLGIKKSSAQLTDLYKPDELVGKQVICVTNFEPKQIGPIMSEVLITGFANEQGKIVLAVPDGAVPNGSRLC